MRTRYRPTSKLMCVCVCTSYLTVLSCVLAADGWNGLATHDLEKRIKNMLVVLQRQPRGAHAVGSSESTYACAHFRGAMDPGKQVF